MLSEISQRKTKTIASHLYDELKIPFIISKEKIPPEVGNFGQRNRMKVAKRYNKLLVKKINKVLGQPAAVEKPGYSQLLGGLSTPLVDSSSQAAD